MVKVAIEFEINQEQSQALNEIAEKKRYDLTQEDNRKIVSIVDNTLKTRNGDLDENYLNVLYAIRNFTDGNSFQAVDQRSFPEFALSHIIDGLDEKEIEVINEDTASIVFADDLATGSLTVNTQKSINYITSFWSDFDEEYLEGWNAKQVFESPELFLVDQTLQMANRVIDVILLANNVGEMSKQEFLDFVNNLGDLELNNLVWE
jgi:hypothetical protein